MGPEVVTCFASSTRRRACAEQAERRPAGTGSKAQMTDDERFSLLVGLTGASSWPVRDERIPQGADVCRGMCRGFPGSGSQPCR